MKKLELVVEEKNNEKGKYFLYYFEFEDRRVYLKPYEYTFSKYATEVLLKEQD